MENRGFYMQSILQDVDSILDLTHDKIRALQSLPGNTIVLREFPAGHVMMREWIRKYGLLPGLQYDAKEGHISLKVDEDAVHKAVRLAMQEFLEDIMAKYSKKHPHTKYSISHNQPCILKAPFEGHIVTSEGQINQVGLNFPKVVVLIGNGDEISRDSFKWLKGSEKKTKCLICVELFERPPHPEGPWGLSDDEIKDMPLEKLTIHIEKWHRRKDPPITGPFTLKIYLCDKKSKSVNPSWICTFGPKRPYVDVFGNEIPTGMRSSRNRWLSTVKLSRGVEVKLPLDNLERRIVEGIKELETERAAFMAAEAQEFINLKQNSGARKDTSSKA